MGTGGNWGNRGRGRANLSGPPPDRRLLSWSTRSSAEAGASSDMSACLGLYALVNTRVKALRVNLLSTGVSLRG